QELVSSLVQPDGHLLVCALHPFKFRQGLDSKFTAYRLNSDGSLDSSFTPVPNVKFLALEPTGTILGWLTDLPRLSIRRFDLTGKLDASFNPPPLDGRAMAILPQNDGKILVGRTGVIQTSFTPGLFRLLPDGSLDLSFKVETGTGGLPDILVVNPVYSIALQPDRKILLGGEFPQVNGAGRINIARVFGGDPIQAPTITKQPASQTAMTEQTVSFSVLASGNPSPEYQWRSGDA